MTRDISARRNFEPTQMTGEMSEAEVDVCKLKGSTIAQEAIRKLARHKNNVAALQAAEEVLAHAKTLPSGGMTRDDDSGRYQSVYGGSNE